MGGGERAHSALMTAMKKAQKAQVIPGTVVAVKASNCTCDVEPVDGGPVYHDVRYRALVKDGDYGIMPRPALGSTVLIGIIQNNENSAFIAQYGKLAELQVMIEDEGLIKLNGEDYTVLKGKETLEEVKRMNERLEAVISALTGWQVIAQDGGAALQLEANAALEVLPEADFDGLENEKVKHG